jgi:hypothetical protein
MTDAPDNEMGTGASPISWAPASFPKEPQSWSSVVFPLDGTTAAPAGVIVSAAE